MRESIRESRKLMEGVHVRFTNFMLKIGCDT